MKALKWFLVLVLIGLISFIVVLVVYGGPEQNPADATDKRTVGGHRVGNLFENINSGGEFACVNGCTFYVAGNQLICADASGSGTILYEAPAGEDLDRENINVLNGWVYWGNDYINKIRTNGTDFRRINFNSRRIDKMYVVDDRLLINTGDALWTVDTNGTDKKLLVSGEVYDMCMANDRLHYRDDAGHIQYVSLDGTKTGTLYSARRCSGLHLYGDRLYFVASGLRSIDLNGKDEVLLKHNYTDAIEYGFSEYIFSRSGGETMVTNLYNMDTKMVPLMKNLHWIDGRYIAQNGEQTQWFRFDPETFERTVFQGK